MGLPGILPCREPKLRLMRVTRMTGIRLDLSESALGLPHLLFPPRWKPVDLAPFPRSLREYSGL